MSFLFFKNLAKRESAFSLIEIMVSMALISLIVIIVIRNPSSDHKDLNDFLNNIERTIHFASDESGLKNNFLRINFNLDSDRPTLSLEYSDNPNLVIDDQFEARNKEDKSKHVNKKSNFSKVIEFEENKFEFPVNIRIIGIATGLSKNIVTEGTIPYYFYPTGEKDSALIILGTNSEMAYLEVFPYKRNFYKQYIQLDDDINDDNYEEKTKEIATDIYKEWIKN